MSLAAALTVVAHPLTSFYFAPFVALWVLLSIMMAAAVGGGERG